MILAAADTFRAAAGEQLTEWANRAGVEIIGGSEGADPDVYKRQGQNLIRDSFSFFIQIFYQNFGDRKLCLYLAWHLTFPFFDQLVDTAAYCSGT